MVAVGIGFFFILELEGGLFGGGKDVSGDRVPKWKWDVLVVRVAPHTQPLHMKQ
jgi:hypothetical protein